MSASGLDSSDALLWHVPFRYVDRLRPQTVGEIVAGEEAYLAVQVEAVRSAANRMHVRVADATGSLDLVFFHGLPYLQRQFKPGQRLAVAGKVSVFDGYQLAHPEWRVLREGEEPERALLPRYSLTEAMAQARVDHRSLQAWALELLREKSPTDTLSVSDREALGLQDLRHLLRRLHAPESWEDVESSRRQLKIREMVPLHRRLAAMRQARQGNGRIYPRSPEWEARFLAVTPFEPTSGQRHCGEGIAERLAGGDQFFGLLQGDVGSGKTWVALFSCLPVLAAGGQVALLAPTEILARQHARNLKPWLEGLGLTVTLLTGSLPAAEKALAMDAIADGQARFVVATHAVLSEAVDFASLGMCIVDEQHRFGVDQRARLSEKGGRPHVLYLSATPIPRSLALAFFGDLDSFRLNEKPAGRLPVKTRLVPTPKRDDLIRYLEEAVAKGGRVFWVVPRIAGGEAPLASEAAFETVETLAKTLRQGRRSWKVAIAHGRQRPVEREDQLDAFRTGRAQVLVATTVIEVGVDIPEADYIVIEASHRFGLAQLHQLRGRTGRGGGQGWCFLPEPAEGFPQATWERLQGFCDTEDGFALAELDLNQRGAGQLAGLEQSGIGGLRFADPLRDFPLMEEIRRTLGAG